MTRAIVYLLVAVFTVAASSARATLAQEKQEKTEKSAAAQKQARWHGIIIRWNKDESTLTVRKGNFERKIHYDSSTQWTQGTKTVDMGEFKEGSDVICLGTYDEKSQLHATRIDLRRQ